MALGSCLLFAPKWLGLAGLAMFFICVRGDSFVVTDKVRCLTTKGDLGIEIYRDWSPLGAERFVTLVKEGFFQEIGFFRCVNRFLTQCELQAVDINLPFFSFSFC